MSERLLTADGAWYGGFYEVALEIGSRSDQHLRAALTALWQYADLDGCFLDRNREPMDQPRGLWIARSAPYQLGIIVFEVSG